MEINDQDYFDDFEEDCIDCFDIHKKWNIIQDNKIKEIKEFLKKLTNIFCEFVEAQTKYDEIKLKRKTYESINNDLCNLIYEQDVLRWIVLGENRIKNMKSILNKNLDKNDFIIIENSNIYAYLLNQINANKPIDILGYAIDCDDEKTINVLRELSKKQLNFEREEDSFKEAIQKILNRNWMNKREEIKLKIHDAQLSDEEVCDLVKKFAELQRNHPKVKE